MFDPLNQNGDDEIDFSEKNLFEVNMVGIA